MGKLLDPDDHVYLTQTFQYNKNISANFDVDKPTGISRDSRHKRRATGGRKANLKKKRMYEMGRPPANTKLGAYRVHPVRGRGGNMKFRAMRLETGNYAWGTESKLYICCGLFWIVQ